MRITGLSWRSVWFSVSLAWVVGVAVDAHNRAELAEERLRLWADQVEYLINADPMVETSAKKLRSEVGDEQFIVEAPKAYPNVNLAPVVQRYDAEKAASGGSEEIRAGRVIALALAPPATAYAFARFAMPLLVALRRRRR